MTEATAAATPPIVDRDAWLAARLALLDREKAHTREGDAIAAAWRRLPMLVVDANAIVVGERGPVRFLDVFEGREQLIVYTHMWHRGNGVADQCRGCTATAHEVRDADYLHHRGVTLAFFTRGPWEEVAPFREFMGYSLPWYSFEHLVSPGIGTGLLDDDGYLASYLRVGDRAFLTNEVVGRGVEGLTMPQARLLDMTVYGRQEAWEDSPEGWPTHPTGTWWVDGERPVPAAVRAGTAHSPEGHEHHHHHG